MSYAASWASEFVIEFLWIELEQQSNEIMSCSKQIEFKVFFHVHV